MGSLLGQLNETLSTKLRATRWWVAFSGGPDSTVLLHLIRQWCLAYQGETPTLHAIHVDHGLHSQSQQWRAHCAGQCAQWDIPLSVVSALVCEQGQGMEAAARQARYSIFESQLGEGDVLFMGHHLDDQVETYFLRLLRGAGIHGLSAMPVSRALGQGELCRPLLDIERHVLEVYAKQQQLVYILDPSNNDTEIDRNYLRQQVLPMLGERWVGYRQTVARAASHAATAVALSEEYVSPTKTVYSALGDPGVSMKSLSLGKPHKAMLILRRWLRDGGYAMPDQASLAEFLRQLRERSSTANPRMQCAEYALAFYDGAVFLLPAFAVNEAAKEPTETVSIRPNQVCELAGVGRVSLLETSANRGMSLTADDVLELRWREGGERCRLLGRPYQQRLKKLLQERRVPPWWRERVPLLYLNNELLCVGDLWLCESSRLGDEKAAKVGLWQLHWERKAAAFD